MALCGATASASFLVKLRRSGPLASAIDMNVMQSGLVGGIGAGLSYVYSESSGL